jgi:hypothetical protein
VVVAEGLPVQRAGRLRGASRALLTAPWWVVAVGASAFGPYVVAGARTEQLVVYGSAPVVLWLMIRSRIRWPRGLGVVLALWLVPTTIGAIGAVFNDAAPAPYALGSSVLAGIDNFALPVVLIGLAGYWLAKATGRVLLDALAVTVITLLSANAVAAVLQFAGVLRGGSVLGAFWAEGPESVATLALGNGRFTGIFGQPLEAGLAYGIALLLLTYAWVNREGRSPVWYAGSLVLLVTGAFLTVSKTVLVLGIPWLTVLLVLRAWRDRRVQVWLALVCLVVVVVGVILVIPMSGRWYGAYVIKEWGRSLVPWWHQSAAMPGGAGGGPPGFGLVETMTATRYGRNGVILQLAQVMLRTRPWFGFGAAGLNIPYDSAWLQLLAVSGLVGMAAYAALLVWLSSEWLRRRKGMSPAQWLLATGVVGLVIGGSVGFPALTVNRSSTLLWLVLLLSVFSARRTRLVPQSVPAEEPAAGS